MRVVLVDNADGRFVADFGEERVFLHATFRRWGAQAVKRYRAILEGTLEGFRRAGVPAVYATPFVSDARAQKLILMFGFTERYRNRDLVLMERRLYA